jgi:hypothetical protein
VQKVHRVQKVQKVHQVDWWEVAMIPRRTILGSGLVSSLAGLTATEAEAGQSDSSRNDPAIAASIDRLRDELRAERGFVEIQPVRSLQLRHLLTNGRWPGFLEVGADVWLDVHDWHIRWQQPLTMGRDSANRYTLVLMGTTLILRTDLPRNFLGIPYDNPTA